MAFAKHPMAFLAAPNAPADERPRGRRMATLSERASWCASAARARAPRIERLFKDAGLPLRIGSEMSSNEAIKHMCAAGFGVAFLSLHTCVLELNAGVLALLPMADNPIERDWYVMHLASRQLPQVALAFEKFLCSRGQQEIARQLGEKPAGAKPRQSRVTRQPCAARPARRAPAP